LCPRTYLRVPDHGDPHLLPCCGYLPWRSTGLNTDSWRPPWGHRHDYWANSKDQIQINLLSANRFQFAEFEVLHVNSPYPREAHEPSGNSANSFLFPPRFPSRRVGHQDGHITVQIRIKVEQSSSCHASRPRFQATKDSLSSLLHAPGRRTQLRLRQLRRTGSTSTSPCTATTRHPAARLYVNLAVRREYSSLGRNGSTSTTPYTAATSSSGRTTTSTTYLD
jgi:hypothetical protein